MDATEYCMLAIVANISCESQHSCHNKQSEMVCYIFSGEL